MKSRRKNSRQHGFTLVELLVSMAILSLLLLLVMSMTDQIASVWKRTSGSISAFQESRAAFETLTRKLSQATLDTYWDYDPPISSGGTPTSYVRRSELHFVAGQASALLGGIPWIDTTGHAVFFTAPLGYSSMPQGTDVPLGNLMNAKGFFIQHGSNSAQLPKFLEPILPARDRYRLMEFWQPTERLSIYGVTRSQLAGNPSLARDWFRQPLTDNRDLARPLAENVVALVLWPQRASTDPGSPITEDYSYDTRAFLSDPTATASRNLLPPTVLMTMVVLDEESAARLETMPASAKSVLQPGQLFVSLPDLDLDAQRMKLDEDLSTLEDFLNDNRLGYRIFNSQVTIRQSKWSDSQ